MSDIAVVDNRGMITGLIGKKVRVRWLKLEMGQIVGPLEVNDDGQLMVFDTDNDPVYAQPGIRFTFENVKLVINEGFMPIIELNEELRW